MDNYIGGHLFVKVVADMLPKIIGREYDEVREKNAGFKL